MRKGFTLIELMIVIAIIAIIAAIAIPNLLESRISSNEAAAATSLKSGVHPAQVQFQSGGYVDGNTNNIGDFSDQLRWMAGDTSYTAMGGGTAQALSLLPAIWNAADASVLINGYLFDNASNNEITFCTTCWPQDLGNSIGRRRFATNASGQIYATAPASTNAAVTTGTPFGASFNSPASGWSPYRR